MPWSRYRINSLSLCPPGFSGCMRGRGSGESWCDAATEDAEGVGRLSAGAALSGSQFKAMADSEGTVRAGRVGYTAQISSYALSIVNCESVESLACPVVQMGDVWSREIFLAPPLVSATASPSLKLARHRDHRPMDIEFRPQAQETHVARYTGYTVTPMYSRCLGLDTRFWPPQTQA